MNINSTSTNSISNKTTVQTSQSSKDSSAKFSDELKELEATEKADKAEKTENTKEVKETAEEKTVKEEVSKDEAKEEDVEKAIEDLNTVVKELNQTEENPDSEAKDELSIADKNNVINNDYNIQDNKDLLPQMNPNMNFSGNGQPFSSFMNENSEQHKSAGILGASAQDLAEEAAILSTMAENMAIANKNQMLNNSVKTVGAVPEVGVPFDTVIMNQADVEVFAQLVQNGEVNLNNLAPEAAAKTVQVSKTLADMLAKSMENNQPLRIDFDNDISVIIRISRDGKLSADFLPSSQVAEAYLRENLPLLKQKFDESGIDYENLSQRERKEQRQQSDRKKGRNDE
jgi:hypothetical protein